MATRMQQRRGTESQWTTADPILNAGEIGFESDTNKFKIGDGINHWSDLAYFADAVTLGGSIDDYIPLTQKGVANGVAELDGNGKLASLQIPNLDEITQDILNTSLVAGTGLDKTYDDNAGTYTIDIDSTVATLTGTQTFTNKTLTSPKINEDVAVTATATELNYVDGVTSAIQTQLNNKAPLDSPTFTGTVTLPANTISQSMMGDDSVGTNEIGGLAVTEAKIADGAVTSAKIADGTIVNGDINASAAIAQSKIDGLTTDLAAKAPLDGPTFVNTASFDDVEIAGALTFSGTATQINQTDITLEDPMIYLAEGNTANINDIGFVGSMNNGTYQHVGLVRDASAGTWKLFKGVTDEPTTTVNFAQGSLDDLSVAGLTATSLTVGDVSNTEFGYLNGVTSALQTQLDAKSPLDSPTFTGTVTIPNGSALGTPTSVTLTNATGLPVSTGISGLGTNVATFLATPSSANFASMISDEIGTGNVILSEIATNAQTDSYTLVLGDKAKVIEMNKATANNLTVPLNSSVAFPVGTQIHIVQTGVGQTTVVATSGVTINATPGLKLRAQWAGATLVKRATDTWVLVGDLAS